MWCKTWIKRRAEFCLTLVIGSEYNQTYSKDKLLLLPLLGELSTVNISQILGRHTVQYRDGKEVTVNSSVANSYHLISQDTIDAIFIERDHPVQPSDLVISQSAIFHIYLFMQTCIHTCTSTNIYNKNTDTHAHKWRGILFLSVDIKRMVLTMTCSSVWLHHSQYIN